MSAPDREDCWIPISHEFPGLHPGETLEAYIVKRNRKVPIPRFPFLRGEDAALPMGKLGSQTIWLRVGSRPRRVIRYPRVSVWKEVTLCISVDPDNPNILRYDFTLGSEETTFVHVMKTGCGAVFYYRHNPRCKSPPPANPKNCQFGPWAKLM